MLYLVPDLSAWILTLAYQRSQATVCDFMNGRGIFFPPSVFPHGSSFTSLRKTREGWVGEGRGGGGGGGGVEGEAAGVSGDRRPPAAAPQPRQKHKKF